MNIQTVIRHLKVLGRISEDFEAITFYLIEDCNRYTDKVKNMDFKSYKIKIKDILLEWCFENKINIKYKDLNLLYFINPLFGSYSLDLVKLDAWLYNKLLDEYGYEIHNMSGMEKLKKYVNGENNIMRWFK